MLRNMDLSYYRGGDGGLVNHANKLGISLRSKDLLSGFPANRRPLSPWSPRVDGREIRKSPWSPRGDGGTATRQTHSRAGSAHGQRGNYLIAQPSLTYIHNVVVPLNALGADGSLGSYTASQPPYQPMRPVSHRHYSNYNQNNNYNHFGGSRGNSGRTTRTPNSRAQSAYKYNMPTSSPREQHSTIGSTTSNRHEATQSRQSLRYENERNDLDKCRTRKRTSEICPHRIDRMYYMTGANVRLAPKYHVEPEELVRLRELSRARKSDQGYGRGMRNKPPGPGDQYDPNHLRSEEQETKKPQVIINIVTPKSEVSNVTGGGASNADQSEADERRVTDEQETPAEGDSEGVEGRVDGIEGEVTEQINDLDISKDRDSLEDGYDNQEQNQQLDQTEEQNEQLNDETVHNGWSNQDDDNEIEEGDENVAVDS